MLTRLRFTGLALCVAGLPFIGACASQNAAQVASATEDKPAAAPADAPEAAPEKAAETETAPEATTHRVKTGRVAVEFEVSGHFESEQMVELVLRPEVWKELSVLEAVAPGTQVKAGQTLVKLDTTKIDEALRDSETEAAIATLSLQQAEYEFALAKQTIPMDLQNAERRAAFSAEDRKRFEEIELPLTRRGVELNVRGAEHSLAYAREELEQLEKMYKADELVEETEEMIIKRQRAAVERAEYTLERTRIEADTTLNIGLPRRIEQVKTDDERQQLQRNHAVATLPIQLQLKELGFAKTQREHEKAAQRRENLRKDRLMMDIVAPIDGLVYYGRAERGRFAAAGQMAQKLRPNGAISPNEVFMTIVQPRPLQVRIDIPETQIRHVKPGTRVTVKAAAYPDVTFNGSILSVANVPTSPGNFEAVVAVEGNEAGDQVLPGMACTLKVIPYENTAAVIAPASAVFKEKDERVVYVKTNDGSERRVVTVGKAAGNQLEILTGLKTGEEILLKKP